MNNIIKKMFYEKNIYNMLIFFYLFLYIIFIENYLLIIIFKKLFTI